MKRLPIPPVLVALLAVGGFAFLANVKADVDRKTPLDLKYTAIDGRQVDLSKMRGKVVLIDFWATWCPPCRAISPDIVALYKKYHDKGFEIVGVSGDSSKTLLVNFIKEEGETWPQYFEESASSNTIADQFGVESLPTLWLVGKDGLVVDPDFREHWVHDGRMGPASASATKSIDAAVEEQLKKP